MGATTLAAGVVVPTPLAIAVIALGILVAAGVLVALLRHPPLDRRVEALEQRDRQFLELLRTQTADIQNVKELLHTIIKGHLNG